MGSIGNRLSQAMGMVKSSVSLPVIIEMAVAVDDTVLQELKRTGLNVTSTSRIAPLVYGMANSETISALSRLNQVAIVSYDEPTSVMSFPLAAKFEHQEIIPVSEAVDAMGTAAVWDAGITGKDVKIGVIDTGGSLNHKMLKPGIKGSYSAVPGETAEDHNDHGSWCASAAAGRPVETDMGPLYGVAPDADLYILKALSNEGQGQMSWVNDCIEKAVLDYKCDVLSMSLGSLTDLAGLDPTSKLVNEVTNKYNTLCVVAAGNSFGPMTVGAPGGAASAITVGSVALKLPKQGVVSTFSSKGPTTGLLIKPDIAAYGGNLITSGVSELIYAAGSFGEYISMAGTSMATPAVAGAMALLRQAKPDLSRFEVEQLFAESQFPHPKDVLTGYGTIHVDKLYSRLFSPRLPLSELGMPMQVAQSVAAVPLTLMPREYSNEQLNVVRLPVIRAN
jgi:Subtilisin-like serine proteases